MQAAGEVFADVGYHAATVRDICSRAGANVASVNYHFGDKHGLYTELLKSVVPQSEMALSQERLASMPAEEALRRFVLSMLLQMTEADRPSWYTRVMAHELVKPTEALGAVVEHIIRPKAKLLCGIVGRIIGRPALDSKTRMCAQSVIGQVVHWVHARPVIALLWPEVKVDRDAIAEIAGHIADFSLAGMKGITNQDTRARLGKRRTPR
jgi:AcrR family transcriptional regulator